MKLDNWPYEFPGAYWIDEQESQAVQDVVQNGSLFRYYGLGPPKYVDAFEAAARKRFNKQYALGINSGTGALIAAMTAMDIGPGCEVIIPSFLWVATVSAVIHQNAIPVLCEVDESLCMDPEDLERKISPRTKLIVPIHMIGTPCNMEAIMAIADRHGISVLEDTAQCVGGSFHGRPLGSFGRMGVYSFQLNKNITCGEGGLLVTDEECLYQRAFSAHDMGMIRVNGRLAMPGPEAVAWGAGRRMAELCGAVASVQMGKLDQILDSMRASKRRVKSLLQNVSGLTFPSPSDSQGDCGSFLLMQLESESQAESLARQMKAAGLHNTVYAADYGLHIYYRIPALVNKIPMSSAGNPWSLPANADSNYTYTRETCPKSDALFARSVILPIPSKLTEQQEQAAVAIIKQSMAAEPEVVSPHYRASRATADALS